MTASLLLTALAACWPSRVFCGLWKPDTHREKLEEKRLTLKMSRVFLIKINKV